MAVKARVLFVGLDPEIVDYSKSPVPGLTAAKVDGKWYGTVTCAEGGECPLENRAPSVPEAALYCRPRRFFRRRRPKELKLGS